MNKNFVASLKLIHIVRRVEERKFHPSFTVTYIECDRRCSLIALTCWISRDLRLEGQLFTFFIVADLPYVTPIVIAPGNVAYKIVYGIDIQLIKPLLCFGAYTVDHVYGRRQSNLGITHLSFLLQTLLIGQESHLGALAVQYVLPRSTAMWPSFIQESAGNTLQQSSSTFKGSS